MTFFEYLSIVRRRWVYLAAGLLVAAVAGFATAPGESNEPVRYEATHTLLVDAANGTGAVLNLDQAALLATTGPVPVRVDEQLAAEGLTDPVGVTALADPLLGSLSVTAGSAVPEVAERAADLTAQEIVAELAGVGQVEYDEQVEALRDDIARTQSQIQSLDGQLAALDLEDPARAEAQAQRQGAASTLNDLESQLEDLEAQGPPAPPLKTLEAADASASSTEGWKLPESRPARALILGALGLALGLLGALAADRLDTRVRGKQDAERAFELPVIAEVPPLTGGKSRELMVATQPASPFVEAYRALRTVVLFAAAERRGANGHAGGPGTNGSDAHRGEVLLITSPAAGEGKTTTAAHLAAVLAEADQRTLVISADFRRPRIHEYFGVPREPGLSDVLASGAGRVPLSELQMSTTFRGVHLLPSGGPVDNPAQLLSESSHLIAAARQLFDFIIIDTPPLLVANDATELAAQADMVILVAKADRTSREAAHRSTEILRRVDAPLLGVIVASAHDTPTAYGYYRYRYYADTDQGATGRRRRRKAAKAAQAQTAQATSAPPTVTHTGV